MRELPKHPPTKFYVTYIPGRSYVHGTYKLHLNIGHSKLAVGYQIAWDSEHRQSKVRGGKIWEWDHETQGWELLYDVEPYTLQNDLPWRK